MSLIFANLIFVLYSADLHLYGQLKAFLGLHDLCSTHFHTSGMTWKVSEPSIQKSIDIVSSHCIVRWFPFSHWILPTSILNTNYSSLIICSFLVYFYLFLFFFLSKNKVGVDNPASIVLWLRNKRIFPWYERLESSCLWYYSEQQ